LYSKCTVNVHGTYLLYASNRIREMQMDLRELRQWTSLACRGLENYLRMTSRAAGQISDSHRPTKWDGIRGRRERCTDEDDYTLVSDEMEMVTVVTEGTYFIYSQIKRLHGIETSMMTCIQSMPSNITVAQNTCYTAGVHYLEPGSTLELCIPRKSAGLDLKPHTTFLGTEG
uniref:THD domain-containing protein n=1 Tax=Salmo trutta TaxID=8032 RepID=A0A674BMQ5_SALTR